ncbi:minor capsid protein [Paenibacillus woosongensis]|uniref:Phage head morphogenesis domain-containing protein n=1 Tax=Paenibacillus woosongensis TaxID=307580 RepID=A0ABQ4MPF4_9BACL|nr:minor capsid protein [Paenibacillus woosongensis]GIP57903.1 hypothetical protein J15TS10_17170 [Paenibacillus woosongensis]
MATKSNTYWDRRANQRMAEYHREAEKTIHLVNRAYDKGLKDIEGSIKRILGKYIRDSGLSQAEAIALLNSPLPRAEWEAIKEQYMKVKDPEVRRKLLNILNAPAYSGRISRLVALKADIYIQSKLIMDAEIAQSTTNYLRVTDQAYYRTMFDLQQGLGLAFEFAAIPTKVVEEILRNPWSGEHFSQRVWKNTDYLAEQAAEVITGGWESGISYKQMTDQLAELMEVGKFAASRLIRTESTYMANAAEIESYKEAEIEKYIFIATLDLRTSQTCQDLDGEIFLVSEAKANVNLPAMHPFCRSTTRALIDAGVEFRLQRRARNPITGEAETLPPGMTYKEWRAGLDKQHGADRVAVMEKMTRNRVADRKQYDEFKGVVGEDVGSNLSDFQDLKYTEPDKWAAVKRQVNTFRKIDAGSYSEAYKDRLRDTYRYFKQEGHEFTIHALNRVEGPKTGKGKVNFSLDDVRALLGQPANYRQPGGKLIYYRDGLSAVQALDTGEIVSVVTRAKPRTDWEVI